MVGGEDAVQVQITQADALYLKLPALLSASDYFFHLRRHNLIQFATDPYFVVMFVGIVIFHQTRYLQKGRIVCEILILNLLRSGVHQFPKQADVPFHQMRHPSARFCTQVSVELVHQLGLPEAGAQVVSQDVSQVLKLHFLEAVQDGM